MEDVPSPEPLRKTLETNMLPDFPFDTPEIESARQSNDAIRKEINTLIGLLCTQAVSRPGGEDIISGLADVIRRANRIRRTFVTREVRPRVEQAVAVAEQSSIDMLKDMALAPFIAKGDRRTAHTLVMETLGMDIAESKSALIDAALWREKAETTFLSEVRDGLAPLACQNVP